MSGTVEQRVAEATTLARQCMEGLGSRWTHVQSVAATMRDLTRESGTADHLLAAAWLHDVGYAPALARTGMHAIDGAVFLDREGLASEVVSLVAFHTGAEYEADERGLVDELIGFDRPSQDDLDMLILADLITAPTGERVPVLARLDEILKRYERQHPVHRAVTRSRPYLEQCALRAAQRVGYPM